MRDIQLPFITMTLSLPSVHKNVWLTAFIAVAIIAVALFLLHHVPAAHLNIIATALLGDMVITLPLAYYFLIVRSLRVRKWSMMLVFSCCCLVAYFILPPHQQAYILQLRELSVLAEFGLVIYGITKFKKLRATYRGLQAGYSDPVYHFYQSMSIVFGHHAAIKFLATELGMLRFGLLFWKRQVQPASVLATYSVHKVSGYGAFFGVILSVCFIEMSGIHLLLIHYNKTAAWVSTALSIYGAVFLIGDYSAVVKSPVLLLHNRILLRTGLRWRVMIQRNNIAFAEKTGYGFEPADTCFKGGVIKNNVNVLLTLKQPVHIERLYRKSVEVTQIALCVDEADNFIQELLRCTK